MPEPSLEQMLKLYTKKDLWERIQQLKQQLAEKEKFLERIMSGKYIPANIAEKSLKLSNQTAIAVLKKVKKLFEEKYAYDVEESDFAVIYETDIDEIIDQQIAELKGETDGSTN